MLLAVHRHDGQDLTDYLPTGQWLRPSQASLNDVVDGALVKSAEKTARKNTQMGATRIIK